MRAKFWKPAKSVATAVAAALLISGTAQAQSTYDYYYGASPFEGAYVGAYAGGIVSNSVAATVGGLAGANFKVTDGILVGVEAQGGVATGGAGTQFDALMLGKAGVLLAPDAMIYGAGGAGVINGTNSWAAGGGGEVMISNDVSLRGEALGAGAWGAGLSQGKVTAGAVWHIK